MEHITLPRFLSDGEDADLNGGDVEGSQFIHTSARIRARDNENDVMERAKPGEIRRATKMYPIWGTPEKELADFGIGV
eukprot:5333862-Ditylum_brightwellii.AAC.1